MKQQEQQANTNKQVGLQLHAVIGEQVLHMLGEPDRLQRVQVRHLWNHHFRVNVLAGADGASAKVVHSYFLSVGDDGNIVTSAPKITKLY